jgi:hypothetical protein
MSELIRRLAEPQRVRVENVSGFSELKEVIERGVISIRFTETRGGTCLTVRLDPRRSELGSADFTSGAGSVRLIGTLVLDFNEVEITAEVDMNTLEGLGHVRVVADESLWRQRRNTDAASREERSGHVH